MLGSGQLPEGAAELQDAVSESKKEESGHRAAQAAPLWLASHMEAPRNLREPEAALEKSMLAPER